MKLTTLKLIAGVSYLFIVSCKTINRSQQIQLLAIGEHLFQLENTTRMINAWLQVAVVIAVIFTAMRFPRGYYYERILFLLTSWILIPNSLQNFVNSNQCGGQYSWVNLVTTGFFLLAFVSYSTILWNRYYYQND
jgi:hypothetical protein